MSDFEDKLKETLESAKEGLSDVADKAKDSFQDVVSEGREVAEEMKAAATGQKLESDVEGAAGYRADESTNSTLSIVALVVGILSIVFAFVYVWVGLALGIAGVIISARARKQSQTKMATAGFVWRGRGGATTRRLLWSEFDQKPKIRLPTRCTVTVEDLRAQIS